MWHHQRSGRARHSVRAVYPKRPELKLRTLWWRRARNDAPYLHPANKAAGAVLSSFAPYERAPAWRKSGRGMFLDLLSRTLDVLAGSMGGPASIADSQE